MEKTRDYIAMSLNGQALKIAKEHAFMMLADFLRYQKKLTGTKIVCAEGDCGACTVLIFRPRIDHQFVPINACIVGLTQLDGAHVITIEALKKENALSPIQRALHNFHGSQCGFCTPGFVMALTGLFEKSPARLSPQKVKNELTGNLCRCTGYISIIEAALSIDGKTIKPLKNYFSTSTYENNGAIKFKHEGKEFYAPTTLEEADKLAQQGYKIRSGNTDLGVLENKDKATPLRILSLNLIDELYDIRQEDERIIVGARVNLSSLRKFCQKRAPLFAQFINIFASPQIKNMATLVGNTANASPIADTTPFLMVCDGMIHLRSIEGSRAISIEKLFVSYKTLNLKYNEYITHISFCLPKSHEHLKLDKVSTRKDLDIATINSAFRIELAGKVIKNIKLAMGGIGPMIKRLKNTEQFMFNKELDSALISDAQKILQQEITPQSDLRASAQFRRVLANNVFSRYLGSLL
ncbi:MAG: FAD binding domain-containing protein [Myxococcales bacterium]|nr:FAD binding domain-containing protein [Myxococcales bacterium]USN50021.1 MAG: FAD binding domain-containing protein [Myxococcales bacterium]